MFDLSSDPDGRPVHAPIINSAFAYADVMAVTGGLTDREITDETARTLASMWQSPADKATAALASGLDYDTDDLLAEIVRHRSLAADERDERALQALSAWVTHRKGTFL
jgi:hypothetical protein